MLGRHEIMWTIIGFTICVIVPSVLAQYVTNIWILSASLTLSIAIFFVFIICLLRRHQHLVREETIHQTKQMLDDIVKNQLSIISVNVQLSRPEKQRLERINAAIEAICCTLDVMSDESLDCWQMKYQDKSNIST